eukprot:8845579-Pyramimonas_sp.AAC.1
MLLVLAGFRSLSDLSDGAVAPAGAIAQRALHQQKNKKQSARCWRDQSSGFDVRVGLMRARSNPVRGEGIYPPRGPIGRGEREY